jgi:chaperonin cofactor prefoldin
MTIEQKATLFNFLQRLQDYDNDISDLSEDDIKNLIGDIKDKVDSCKDFLTSCESRVTELSSKIDELRSAKTSIENTIKNFKNYLVYAMKENQTPKLQGNYYTLSMQERKTYEFKLEELNIDTFMELNAKQPDTVKHEFKLSKTNFKQLCDNNPDLKEKYATESVNSFSTFRVKKGVK